MGSRHARGIARVKVEAPVVMNEGQLLCSRDRRRRCLSPYVSFQKDLRSKSLLLDLRALLLTERVWLGRGPL